MRILTTILLSLIIFTAQATNYYVDATGGNDANPGTISQPWRTLTKVNATTYAANDSIFLKRGETWYGAVTVNRNNLYFGAYGSGAKPIITGVTSLTSWIPTGSNKWRCAITLDSTVSLLTINGEPQEFARDTAGWRRYTAVSSTQILLPHVGNWVGRTMVLKANDWRIERVVITKDSSGYLTFRSWYNLGNGSISALEPTKTGYGCFLVDDTTYLNVQNEWVLTDNAVYLYSTSAPTNVKVPTIDTLFNIGTRQNITVENIRFEYGGLYCIYAIQTQNILINNCDIANTVQGFGCYRLYNSTISNNTFDNCLQTSIYVQSVTSPYINVSILNNVITDNGLWVGMGSYNQYGDYSSMSVTSYDGLYVRGNYVVNAGDAGIKWGGSTVDVGYNWVQNFCLLTADRAGIYTFWELSNPNSVYYDDRRVHNNFISYGFASTEGTPSTVFRASGIYMDGVNGHVLIDSNYIWNYPRSGVNLNCDSFVTVRNNIFVPGDSSRYVNARIFGVQQVGTNVVRNFLCAQNIGYLFPSTQYQFYYTAGAVSNANMPANLSAIGIVDSNYYDSPTILNYGTEAGTPYFLARYNHTQFVSTFGFGANDRLNQDYAASDVLFVKNWDNKGNVIPLTGSWVDSYGTTYNNSITLSAYSGALLFRSSAPPPPPGVNEVKVPIRILPL